MSRVEMISDDAPTPEVEILYEAVNAMLGRVPHSYRALAQSPLVAMMMVPFNAVLQRQGAGSILTTKIKEMVVVKTSHVNACAY